MLSTPARNIFFLPGQDDQQQVVVTTTTPLARRLKAAQEAAAALTTGGDIREQQLAVGMSPPEDPRRRRESRQMTSTNRSARQTSPAAVQKTARAYRHRDSIAVAHLHKEIQQQLQHQAATRSQVVFHVHFFVAFSQTVLRLD